MPNTIGMAINIKCFVSFQSTTEKMIAPKKNQYEKIFNLLSLLTNHGGYFF